MRKANKSAAQTRQRPAGSSSRTCRNRLDGLAKRETKPGISSRPSAVAGDSRVLRMGSLPIAVNFVDIEGLPFSLLRLTAAPPGHFKSTIRAARQPRTSSPHRPESPCGVCHNESEFGRPAVMAHRVLQGISPKVAATQRATFRSSMPDERWSARCGRPFSHLRLRRRYFLRTRVFGRSTASRPPTASAGVPA